MSVRKSESLAAGEILTMWVSKPIYESLPYFYLLSGLLTLAASMYLNYGYWPSFCFTVGLSSLVGGLVVLLKRRDHRANERRVNQHHEYP